MDDIDVQIIQILRKDGRIPYNHIARKVGLSDGSVRRRIENLIADDVIQIVAVPNPMVVGYPIVARLDIEVDVTHLAETAKALANMEQISYAAYCVAGFQLTAEVLARSVEDLRRIAFHDVSQLPGVRSLQVTPISKIIKRTYAADY